MKVILWSSFFLLLLIPTLSNASTPVSGSVSGVWDVAGSPYYVMDNCWINTGDMLTIEPGVEVLFVGYYWFEVCGTLYANGQADNYIRFSSALPDPQLA